MREKCGVVGAASTKGSPISSIIIDAMEALQHRGQESWGVALNGGRLVRRMGLLIEGHQELQSVRKLDGDSGIGHVRYSTMGRTSVENAHPIPIGNMFCIAQNGTIVNTDELEEKVRDHYIMPIGTTDTELLGLRLHQILQQGADWFGAFDKLADEIHGGYSLTILNQKGEVIAFRDPRGFRPLCLGWHEESSSYMVASESCALGAVGAKFVRDIEPGEVLKLDGNGIESRVLRRYRRRAQCSFEYTYFAHPSSVIDGVSVYEARKRIGTILADRTSQDGDVVIPVPDSGRPAALGYSERTGIPLEEGLMKDRYRRKGSIRSFIEPTEASREEVVKKIIPIKPSVEGKDVIVVDDSIVRGTSSRIIVKALRDSGAKRVSMVITFPPIMFPCYAGIDFPTQDELLAFRTVGKPTNKEVLGRLVAKEIGADGVEYNDAEGLRKGIGLPFSKLCLSCTNGEYGCIGCPVAFKTREQMKA